VKWEAASPFAWAAREQRRVSVDWYDAETSLRTGMISGKEPVEGQLGVAEWALGFLQPPNANFVKMVFAGSCDHNLHQQWVGANRAVHRAIERE